MSGAVWKVGLRWAGKVRVAAGKKGRVSRLFPEGLSEVQAEARCASINRLALRLRQAGQQALVERTVDELAAAAEDELPRLAAYVERRLVAGARKPRDGALTFQQFAERWTSGELHRQYPDRVKAKDSKDDVQRLTAYVYPHIGHLQLADIDVDDLEGVLSELPRHLGPGTRRQVAQVMARVLRLAAMPAKLIRVSPVPEGFLPTVGKVQFPFLRPQEEALLVACEATPILRRLFFALVCREGFRREDLAALTWSALDLEVGVVTLDRHKTSEYVGSRSWMLRRDSVVALSWLQAERPRSRGPFEGFYVDHLAEQLRADVARVGVTRPELFSRERGRGRLTEHCLRRTFVTLALAEGRSDAWVTDRTGHTTTQQLARYKASARLAAELNLGPLLPLDQVVPELLRAKPPAAAPAPPKSTPPDAGERSEQTPSLDTLEPPGCLALPLTHPEPRIATVDEAPNFLDPVHKEGLEPTRREAPEPKSDALRGAAEKPAVFGPFDLTATPPKTGTRQRLDTPPEGSRILTRVALAPAANDCGEAHATLTPRLLGGAAFCSTGRAAA